MPWMFALDRTHYSRWVSVHIWDMRTLSEKHPDILEQFKSGNFVVHKTRNKFSAMALDQCREQNNAMVKVSGGAIGLTGNAGALRCWMVAGPEIARIITEFEEQGMHSQYDAGNSGNHHHDQQPSVPSVFFKEVGAIVTVLEEMGHSQLLVIDTREILDPQVAETEKD